MLLESDNGRWALDDVQLALLVRYAQKGFMEEWKAIKVNADGKKDLSAEWYKFEKLISFLRNPYKE